VDEVWSLQSTSQGKAKVSTRRVACNAGFAQSCLKSAYTVVRVNSMMDDGNAREKGKLMRDSGPADRILLLIAEKGDQQYMDQVPS
jgi:nicotinate-nucleotide pyrophosphorylase